MFDHQCSVCERRQLIFPSQILALTNSDAGIVVDFICWCGAPQSMLTGAAAATSASRPRAAA
jgi:hypothetical protein